MNYASVPRLTSYVLRATEGFLGRVQLQEVATRRTERARRVWSARTPVTDTRCPT